MAKHKLQYLKNLVSTYAPFPNAYSQLSPCYKNRYLIMPFYGENDSKFSLSVKMTFLLDIVKPAPVHKLIKKFNRLTKEEQKYIAYNLCHELKVASLASWMALNNQERNVYEIGPWFGFSSHFYSRVMKEKGIASSNPIYKLIAIESNKEYFQKAKELLEMTNKAFITQIEYIHGDGISYITDLCKDNDIIFASLAEPDVCEGILGLSRSKKINFVVSYSEKTNNEIKRRRDKSMGNLINPDNYEIYPFEDKEYNIHADDTIKRFGVFVLSTSKSRVEKYLRDSRSIHVITNLAFKARKIKKKERILSKFI